MSWRNVGTRYMHLLITARRAGKRIAMDKVAMAGAALAAAMQRGSPSTSEPATLAVRAVVARRSFPPGDAIIVVYILAALRSTIALKYWDAAQRSEYILAEIGLMLLLITPIHTTVSFVVMLFVELVV